MFIGREKELADLNALYDTDKFQMPVIYGRRRVGKSTLIRKFVEDKKAVLFTKIGRWWGTNPKLRQEEEINIVGVNPLTKCVLLGECKYQNQGIHLETAKKLMERGLLITAYPNKSYVLCSKTQFTEEVKRLAKENKILLVTLTDLYRV